MHCKHIMADVYRSKNGRYHHLFNYPGNDSVFIN